MSKKFWKCKVCGDIHWGNAGPEMCPTCDTKNVYSEVTKEEAKDIMEL
jgi:rubrerythrin